jgi:hypothetical protein
MFSHREVADFYSAKMTVKTKEIFLPFIESFVKFSATKKWLTFTGLK